MRRKRFAAISVAQTPNKITFSYTGSYIRGQQPFDFELLGINARPREIRLNGQVVTDVAFDPKQKRVSFTIGNQNEIILIREILIIP